MKYALILLAALVIGCSPCKEITQIKTPTNTTTSPTLSATNSSIVVPVHLTADTLTAVVNQLLSKLTTDQEQTIPVSFNTEDSQGTVTSTIDLQNVNLKYGFKPTPGKLAIVTLDNDLITISAPISAYGRVKTKINSYDVPALLATFYNELNKRSPLLAKQVADNTLDELDRFIDKNLGKDLHAPLKESIRLGHQINNQIYQLSLPYNDITVAGQQTTVAVFREYAAGLVEISKGKPAEAIKHFEESISKCGDYTVYVSQRMGSTVSDIRNETDRFFEKAGLPKELAGTLKAPLDITKETLRAYDNTVKETERAVKKIGNIGKKLEKGFKKTKKRWCKWCYYRPLRQSNIYYASTGDDIISHALSHEHNRFENDLEKLAGYLKEIPISLGCGESDKPTEILVKISAKVKVNSDYSVSLTLADSKFEWQKECDITNISFLDKKIREQITEKATDFLKDASENASKKFSVKEYAQKSWDLIQTQTPFTDKNAKLIYYAKFNPQNLIFDGIKTKGDTLTAILGTTGKFSLGLVKDATTATKIPLPQTLVTSAPTTGSPNISVIIHGTVGMDSLNMLAQKMLPKDKRKLEFYVLKKSKKLKLKYATIREMKISSANGNLIIATCLKGLIGGVVYAYGKPNYDEATQEIRFKDFEWTQDTKNYFTLLNIADMTMHKKLAEVLEKTLAYKLGKSLNPQIEKFNATWVNNVLKNNMTVNAKIHSLKPLAFESKDDGLECFFELTADGELIFKKKQVTVE